MHEDAHSKHRQRGCLGGRRCAAIQGCERHSMRDRRPNMTSWITLQHHALLLLLLLYSVTCSPIMVPSGKVGPIVPPTPRPRKIVQFPVKNPPPVHEYPDPALEPPFGNSIADDIYERKAFGMQLRNPPPPPVGVFLPRTLNALKINRIAYQLSLKYPQYKLFL